MSKETNLIVKIAQVTKALGNFQADKSNRDQGYDYISADQVLSRVGLAMAEHEMAVIPTIANEAVEYTTFTNRQGRESTRLDATIEFDMLVTAGGSDNLTVRWVGRGSDYATPDKALYKAVTSGHKYFLMKLFNIGIGNTDSEHENGTGSEEAVKQAKPQRKPKGNGQSVGAIDAIRQEYPDKEVAAIVSVVNRFEQAIIKDGRALAAYIMYRQYKDEQGQSTEDAIETVNDEFTNK